MVGVKKKRRDGIKGVRIVEWSWWLLQGGELAWMIGEEKDVSSGGTAGTEGTWELSRTYYRCV